MPSIESGIGAAQRRLMLIAGEKMAKYQLAVSKAAISAISSVSQRNSSAISMKAK